MNPKVFLLILFSSVLFFVTACGNGDSNDSENQVLIDGSSTVYPIMEAVSEEYLAQNPDVTVTVGVSGTGGGFEKFIAGETDISNASRPITEEEMKLLEENGIEYTEFEVALDGLSVVVNKSNDWVSELTIKELQKMWLDTGNVKTWADVREGWPDEEIQFFSPGTDSGTYDYFDEVVLEGEQIRRDASLSEDDNVLVQGVTGTENGIGFFGYAYYHENKDKLKVVPIVNSKGEAVTPSQETVQSGVYEPLSRPLYIYVRNDSLQDNEAVYKFTKYTMESAGELAEAVGYVALPDQVYEDALNKLDEVSRK